MKTPSTCHESDQRMITRLGRLVLWLPVERQLLIAALAGWLGTSIALPNGGPFVVKYPGGDPAAKGVLARLSPDLKPTRETRLKVVKEDLTIQFLPDRFLRGANGKESSRHPCLVAVTAEYLITNATAETVEVDFGFPIMRGIYLNPLAMMPTPAVQVRLDRSQNLRPTLISNSAIYGLLRRRAMIAIDQAIRANPELQRLVERVSSGEAEERKSARQSLVEHLTGELQWSPGHAALLAAYATLRPPSELLAPVQAEGMPIPKGKLRLPWGLSDASVVAAASEALWAAQAIGERKATQWLSLLAQKLAPSSAGTYEAVFEAWGGDVRERSIDMTTGRIRPREMSLSQTDREPSGLSLWDSSDPTIYARVNFLEENKTMTEVDRNAWREVLKQLPVIFTYAPMNLLHYQVTFGPGRSHTVTVAYKQCAYLDTGKPNSYQIAYVLHPASLWDSFGPIHLTVLTPTGVAPISSADVRPSRPLRPFPVELFGQPTSLTYQAHVGTLTRKTGELLVGIIAEAWENALQSKTAATQHSASR